MMLPGCLEWQASVQTPIEVRFLYLLRGRAEYMGYRCTTALMQEYRNVSILSTNIAIRSKIVTMFLV